MYQPEPATIIIKTTTVTVITIANIKTIFVFFSIFKTSDFQINISHSFTDWIVLPELKFDWLRIRFEKQKFEINRLKLYFNINLVSERKKKFWSWLTGFNKIIINEIQNENIDIGTFGCHFWDFWFWHSKTKCQVDGRTNFWDRSLPLQPKNRK